MEQPEELSLLNVFSGAEYIVPIYQRNYAWEKDEIEQLLNDIYDFSDTRDPLSRYYLGSLIVDDLGNNQFSVIDGQQRLTTVFLLFTYLRNMKKDLDVSEKSLGFEAREKSNRTLRALFDGKRYEISNSLYSRELTGGYDVIENYFEERKQRNGRNIDLDGFISGFEKIHIIRTQVPKDIDLNHYFEIMNTRGEQLEIHEIAKGKVIAKISDLEKRQVASMIWDNCFQMDKYIQMTFKPVGLRDIIFSENWDRFDLYENFDGIFNVIRTYLNSKNSNNIDEFSLREKLDKPEKTEIGKISDNSDDENQRFESIISFSNFLLVVNEALSHKKEENGDEDDGTLDDKKFLTTLAHHWDSEDQALDFIFNLLKYRFIFDTCIIKREYAKDHKEEGKWTLNKLISKTDPNKKPYYDTPAFSVNQKEILTLQSALRVTYTSPKTMHWISRALNNTDTILEELEKFSCEKLKKASYHSAKGFGFDRIVFTYLDYILYRDIDKSGFLKGQKLDSYQFMFRTSIEHFHPRHPLNGDSWMDLPDDPLNDFGNLALITVSANSKFTNLNPSSKIKEHDEIIGQSPKLMRMKELMQTGDDGWTIEKVKKHCKEMFDLLDAEIEKYGLN